MGRTQSGITQGTIDGGQVPVEDVNAEKQLSTYRVLRQLEPGANGDPSADLEDLEAMLQAGALFVLEDGEHVAATQREAIKAACPTGNGTFAAVPVRSWKPATRKQSVRDEWA